MIPNSLCDVSCDIATRFCAYTAKVNLKVLDLPKKFPMHFCAYKAKVNLKVLDLAKKYKLHMQAKITKITTKAAGSKAFHKSNVKH